MREHSENGMEEVRELDERVIADALADCG